MVRDVDEEFEGSFDDAGVEEATIVAFGNKALTLNFFVATSAWEGTLVEFFVLLVPG